MNQYLPIMKKSGFRGSHSFFTESYKNRGDREVASLSASVQVNLFKTPLISAIVTPNLFEFTISKALVRFNFGMLRNLHSNGNANVVFVD